MTQQQSKPEPCGFVNVYDNGDVGAAVWDCREEAQESSDFVFRFHGDRRIGLWVIRLKEPKK